MGPHVWLWGQYCIVSRLAPVCFPFVVSSFLSLSCCTRTPSMVELSSRLSVWLRFYHAMIHASFLSSPSLVFRRWERVGQCRRDHAFVPSLSQSQLRWLSPDNSSMHVSCGDLSA